MALIARLQLAIRLDRQRIALLEAGDYSSFRYCSSPEIARYIISQYETRIAEAERLIRDNTSPEDFA